MSLPQSERYNYLPNVLRLVFDAAGENAMLRLWSAHGGERIVSSTLYKTMPVEAEAIIKMMRREQLEYIDGSNYDLRFTVRTSAAR